MIQTRAHTAALRLKRTHYNVRLWTSARLEPLSRSWHITHTQVTWQGPLRSTVLRKTSVIMLQKYRGNHSVHVKFRPDVHWERSGYWKCDLDLIYHCNLTHCKISWYIKVNKRLLLQAGLPGLWEMVLKTNKYVPATKIATHCIIAALTTHLLQDTAAWTIQILKQFKCPNKCLNIL